MAREREKEHTCFCIVVCSPPFLLPCTRAFCIELLRNCKNIYLKHPIREIAVIECKCKGHRCWCTPTTASLMIHGPFFILYASRKILNLCLTCHVLSSFRCWTLTSGTLSESFAHLDTSFTCQISDSKYVTGAHCSSQVPDKTPAYSRHISLWTNFLTFHHCWIDVYPWDCRERSTLAIWNSLLCQNLENKNWHNENECGHDIASVTHKLSDHCHYQWIVVTSAITTHWLHRLPPVDVGKCTRIYQNFRQTTRQMFVSWVSFTYPEAIPHTLTAWFS